MLSLSEIYRNMVRNRHIIAVIVLLLSCFCAKAQHPVGNGLEFDKMVHNFGEIMLKSGPVSCTFTLKNTGSKPAVIYNVASTCGCTDVNWTREPIRPGKTGTISVTYSNDEGAYPFDKNLTVYVSEIKKPVILKVRGVSLAEKKPLSELYPIKYGALGLRESLIKGGNLEQGTVKSEAVMVANLSGSPISVDFMNVSENLNIKVSPNPIPAQSTAEMSFTVTADRDLWGKNTYYASPVVNGKAVKGPDGSGKIGIWAFTKENFDDMTEAEKSAAPRPMFESSTCSFGKVKRGTVIHAEYTLKNQGKTPFKVYKVDADTERWSHGEIPVVDGGKIGSFKVDLDTKDMPSGEVLVIVTLTTNSPLRPIVNLFIAGYIE